jgi:hypothetical protein
MMNIIRFIILFPLFACSHSEPKTYPEQLEQVLKDHQQDFDNCYTQELNKGHEQGGKISVKFEVSPSGKVPKVHFQTDSLTREMAECVGEVIKNLNFPKPSSKDGNISVSKTFSFRR